MTTALELVHIAALNEGTCLMSISKPFPTPKRDIKYKFGILKICEETNSVTEETLKLVKINSSASSLLYKMENFLDKHNSEFVRDAYSQYFLKTNI